MALVVLIRWMTPAQEEDALTYSNYGDALMQQAEVLWEAGAPEAGQCAAAALQAYEQACSLTDSTDGDDLPGLLANWGTGLVTVAQHTMVRTALPGSSRLLAACSPSSCQSSWA
jgi:hypothetical protein